MEEFRKDIVEGLNPAQAKAVKEYDGASLIIAGAGSGKTRVLTCRIANIIAGGCSPRSILALTFTKKAAGEMKERIAAMIGQSKARGLWMGTFHSIFIKFLRGNAQLLGYPEQFTIYDQSDSRAAIKQCIKELNLDDKLYKANSIQARISNAKNNLFTAASYAANAQLVEEDAQSRRPRLKDIFELYNRKCKIAGAMDFDDILLNTNILFRDFPDALEMIRNQFKYILVDEYQDTNYAQYLILKKLASEHRNICVVGDDSQSIYSFRGARIENILSFKKDYPEANIIRLEQNYRSTQTIVNAANSIIERNGNRIKKVCFSEAEQGEKITLINAFTEQEEGMLIANSITERIYRTKAAYDQFAILYRTNAQSRSIEEALRRRNLPYRVLAGFSFYDRAEVKDMMAYFRLCVNPKDDESLKRVINFPARGIGDTSITRLQQAATANGISMLEAIKLSNEELLKFDIKSAAISKLRGFESLIYELCTKTTTANAYEMAIEIGNRSNLLLTLKADTSVEGLSKFQNIEELFNSVKNFCDESIENAEQDGVDAKITLSDYLENIVLLSAVEREESSENTEDTNNKITLMTVHSSKGLEFPYVYIAGMEENLFPSGSDILPSEIEEERRLFYVALTRAKKAISLSFAANRMRWGKSESNSVSRFVREIDPQYIDGDVSMKSSRAESNVAMGRAFTSQFSRPTRTPLPSRPSTNTTVTSAKISSEVASISSLKVGQRVHHDRFGLGVILAFEDSGANQKAIVEFSTGEKRTLLLKYAKLHSVE